MKGQAGKVFSIADNNPCVPGCTISEEISSQGEFSIEVFSLAEDTDISPESYGYNKLWIVEKGSMHAVGQKEDFGGLSRGQMFVTPVNTPIGVRADKDTVYTEIALKEDTEMNKIVKAGDTFALKEMLPYQEGKIVNMDLINDPHMKFVLMSFDQGTGLSEHAAPGDALIFALDGEAVIGYEGEEHTIHAGENFKFDKMGRHYVRADKRFKMALLLELEA